jgi:hypothetical protein
MIRSFIGSVCGGLLGCVAGATVFNVVSHGDFGMLVMLGVVGGCIAGSIIGSTGAIVHAVRDGKSSATPSTP